MKRFTILITYFFLHGVSNILIAQDPIFSQFYANPLYLNPAFAGVTTCPKVNLNYRLQWSSIAGTYITYSASYDQHSNLISGGWGLLITHDDAGKGTLTTSTVSGIYSYLLTLRKFSIKMGCQATWFQKSIDWSKLTFGDMIDARSGFIYNTTEVPSQNSKSGLDFSAGMLGYE